MSHKVIPCYLGKHSIRGGGFNSMMKLYVYEHCPFCVITKMIFALKNHPVEVAYLLYDDVQTPMQMVGRKMLPVLETKPRVFMSESAAIIAYIDQHTDQPKITLSTHPVLVDWVNGVQRFIYRLTYPRWIRAPFAEFSTESAQKYFVQTKDPSGRGFISDLTDVALTQRGQKALDALELALEGYPLLDAQRQLSITDFSVFAQLHSLSIVAGLTYGPIVDRWRKQASDFCSIMLHDEFAN